MGLISKKLNKKQNDWLKNFGKKAAGATLAASIGFASIFGLTGCKNEDNNKNNETDNKVTEMEQDFSALSDIVKNLKTIVDQLGIEDFGISAKITEVEQKIASINAGNGNQDEIISEISSLIADIQDEILALKDRIEDLESDKTTADLESELAKINARLAVENAANNNYLRANIDLGTIITSPNGDLVAARGEFDDYAYYNKASGMYFVSNQGEEFFYNENNNNVNISSAMSHYLSDENFTLNKTESNKNLYVFTNNEGATISVAVEHGSMSEFKITDEDYSMSVEKSTETDYNYLLLVCKSHLKSIGIFDTFKNELDASLDYKYKGVTGVNTAENVQHATGVMSGVLLACEGYDENGHKFYSLQNKSNQYTLEYDKSDNIVMFDKYDAPPSDAIDSLKYSVTSFISNSQKNTISYDEENDLYTIMTYSENDNMKIEVAFNDDLSLDIKFDDLTNGINVSYKIEKITKAQFDEVYNKINSIIQAELEKTSGVNV